MQISATQSQIVFSPAACLEGETVSLDTSATTPENGAQLFCLLPPNGSCCSAVPFVAAVDVPKILGFHKPSKNLVRERTEKKDYAQQTGVVVCVRFAMDGVTRSTTGICSIFQLSCRRIHDHQRLREQHDTPSKLPNIDQRLLAAQGGDRRRPPLDHG